MNKAMIALAVVALLAAISAGCRCDQDLGPPPAHGPEVAAPPPPGNSNVTVENVDPVSREVPLGEVPAKVLAVAKNELPTVTFESASFTSNEGSRILPPDYTLGGVDSAGKRGTVRVDVSAKVHEIDGPIPLDRVPSDIMAEATAAMPGVTFKTAWIRKRGGVERTVGLRDFYEVEGVDARGKVRRHKHKLPPGQVVR